LFSGFAHHLDRCGVCGLVYERNPGDTWAFTIIGDRLPVGAGVVLLYFGFGRSHNVLGVGAFVVMTVLLLVTSPNRWGRHRASLRVACLLAGPRGSYPRHARQPGRSDRLPGEGRSVESMRPAGPLET
jgi:hypothetical protein